MLGERIAYRQELYDFIQKVLLALEVTEQDASIVADNLVTSSLRGIDSHGVGALKLYVTGLQKGFIIPHAEPEIVKESPVLAKVTANNCLGQVAGVFGMNLAIEKTKEMGFGFVTVSHSNHYGFAGHYSMMALEHNLLGMTMTNSAPLMVPTFAKDAMIGTNPIALAVPTKDRLPWVLDMATSVVPMGKIEVHYRLGKEIPDGWATDETGVVTNDPELVFKNVYSGRPLGGIFPLGGEGENHGGHKGYGLSTMVDILCGVMTGANYGRDVTVWKDGEYRFPNIGHVFIAIDPSFFMKFETFIEKMDDMIDRLRNAEKAPGESRVFIHGEKEFEEYERRMEMGVPIDEKTTEIFKKYSDSFGIDLPYS